MNSLRGWGAVIDRPWLMDHLKLNLPEQPAFSRTYPTWVHAAFSAWRGILRLGARPPPGSDRPYPGDSGAAVTEPHKRQVVVGLHNLATASQLAATILLAPELSVPCMTCNFWTDITPNPPESNSHPFPDPPSTFPLKWKQRLVVNRITRTSQPVQLFSPCQPRPFRRMWLKIYVGRAALRSRAQNPSRVAPRTQNWSATQRTSLDRHVTVYPRLAGLWCRRPFIRRATKHIQRLGCRRIRARSEPRVGVVTTG